MSDDGRPLNSKQLLHFSNFVVSLARNSEIQFELLGSQSISQLIEMTAVTEPAPGEVIVHWGRDNVTSIYRSSFVQRKNA